MHRVSLKRNDACVLSGWQFWLSSPVCALLFPVLYVCVLFGFQAVALARPVASSSVLYFGLVVALITGSAWVGINSERQNKRGSILIGDGEGTCSINRHYFVLICLLGFLAFLFSMLDLLSTTPLITLLNPVEMRSSFMSRETSLWAYPANLLLPFTDIALALTIVYFRTLSMSLRVAGLFVGSTSTILGLLLAGRMGMIMQAVFLFFWLLQRPLWDRRTRAIPSRGTLYLLAFLFVGVLAAAAMLSQARSGSDAQAVQVLSTNEDTVSINRNLLPVMNAQSPAVATGMAEVLLYWTSPIVYFDEVYRSWELGPDFIGVFSPFLERRLSALGLGPSAEDEWQHWCDMTSGAGLDTHSWGTVATQFIKSFGRGGTLVVCVVFGYWLGRLFVRGRRNRSFTYLYISSLFYVFLFAYMEFSVFVEPAYDWSIIGIFIWSPLVKRAISAKRGDKDECLKSGMQNV